MFSNFVSLGSSCHTAASMSGYGLRSWSGPFDWLISGSLEWVMYYIEHDFQGFLEKEYLERWSKDSQKFINRESGFIFCHDGECPVGDRYNDFRFKYQKRIDRFIIEEEKPTCFLRYFTDMNEIDYIEENTQYINDVIKRKNRQNEIIFLIETNSKSLKIKTFRNYFIPVQSLDDKKPLWEQLRKKFDNTTGFLEYCASNYSAVSMINNIKFDHNIKYI